MSSRTYFFRFSILLALMLISVVAIAPSRITDSQDKAPAYKNARLPVDQRVTDLLSRMTLEEKIAQLTCL